MVVILNTEMYLDGSNAEANLDALMMTGCGILAVSKVTCFRLYSSRLIINFSSAAKDYNELDNDNEKRTIMRRHAYMAKVTLISLVLSSNCCAAIFAILPVLLRNVDESNVTMEETVIYPMPSAHVIELVNFPKNLQIIIFITEFLMLVVTSVGNLGSDGFFFGIVFHLCGQAEVLKMEFSRVVDGNGKVVKNFHLLLKRHIYLLKLGQMLSDTISVILAIQLSTSCILICTCGFQFLVVLQDGNTMLSAKTLFVLNALMIQLFAFSYVGDYLKCQMDSIGYSLYKCGWYMLPSNVAKNITFVILKAQKPMHLMAGKFFVVNLEGFMSILKTSMSYLSVLRVMINTKDSDKINRLFLDLFEHSVKMRTSKNKDFAYAMRPFKILSWSMGIWPLQVYNSFAFIRYLFVVGILLLMVAILNTEMYLDGSDAEANLDALMMSGCGILAMSKVTCFRIYSSRLIINFSSAAKDYNELDNDDDNDNEKRTIMRRHAYMAKVTLISMVFSANFCAAIFAILPVLLSNEEESNVTVKDTVSYPMPSAHVIELVKFPESLQLIVFFMEFLMLVVTSMGNLGSDAFFFGIVFHLCGQVEILKIKFSRAIDDNGRGAENLHSLINRHDYLLKLSVMLNDTISLVLAMQLLSSCILICTCGFQFILALHDGNVVMVIKTFIILSTLMIQLFGYSYVGNYLKCQMDEIGYSSYNCSWYKLPTNVAKDIVIVILNAQKPVHLMAGKFFVVNLEGFMSILKTSMSYLSVLRVMINA
ncbi:uncharacterized protein LOC117603818 [Osmia lignaria lignaria]|uniref:uncharacterized protein LOC117603818 n=1 Tax=Osmia lignaria lignaria TaxID=1437193 RepID=UPI00402B57BB